MVVYNNVGKYIMNLGGFLGGKDKNLATELVVPKLTTPTTTKPMLCGVASREAQLRSRFRRKVEEVTTSNTTNQGQQ